jgi:Predicted endonuclease distantly related to archaeal Holliday junction resolvase and Mrr-like restriction enzymes
MTAEIQLRDIYDADYLDGHEFEYWCAALLQCNGFTNVSVTRGSGDQGVDIIAHKDGKRYAIQCKRFVSSVSNKAVQEVYAGRLHYGCNAAAVMTNSFFTPSAVELARSAGVELWDRNQIIDWLNIANGKSKFVSAINRRVRIHNAQAVSK